MTEPDDLPESSHEYQGLIPSYLLTSLCAMVYSLNLKHGEGYFHFDAIYYFEKVKVESIAITIILSVFALIWKLEIATLKMPFHPIFILTWIIFSFGKLLKYFYF